MVNTKSANAKEHLPGPLLLLSLFPRWAPANPRLHRRTSNNSRSIWLNLLWGHCSFPLGPELCKALLCPPRVEPLFSPWKVLGKSCNQILLALKVRFLKDSYSLCQIPRQGNLTWGSEPSQQWENFFGFIALQFVGCLLGGYGIWSYCDYAPPIISDWGQEEKGMTEDEMAGWHHWLNGHESE